jgi:hypothetical protein
MVEIIERFLELLWPTSSAPTGYFTLFRLPARKGQHFPLAARHEIATRTVEWDQAAIDDVYFGLGLRQRDLGRDAKGGAADVIAWPGLWVDLDLQGPTHAAENLPPSLEVVEQLLGQFALAPSALVHSGYGLHAYYLLDTPYVAVDAAGQAAFKQLLQQLQWALRGIWTAAGYVVDHTAKLDQILRLPGTHNYKRKAAGQIEVVHNFVDDGPRYPLGQVTALLQGQQAPRKKQPPRLAAGQGSSAAASTAAGAAQAEVPPAGGERGLSTWQEKVKHRAKRLTNDENRALAGLALAGKPFAAAGARNETANKLVGAFTYLAYKLQPGVTPQEIYDAFFAASITAMAQLENDPGNPALTEDEILDQIRRAIENAERDTAIKLEADRRLATKLHELATRKGQPRLPPTPVPKANGHDTTTDPNTALILAPEIVREALPPIPPSPAEIAKLRQQIIIQHMNVYYVAVEGVYQTPLIKEALLLRLRDDFANEPAVDFYYEDTEGNEKKKQLPQLLDDYGTVSRKLVYDLAITESYYDAPAQTFYEAVTPVRDLEPRFDPAIQAWLEIFGGRDPEKFLDWIATITYLAKQTCALYVSGPPNTGKSLLAFGLSRLWSQDGAPTELGQVLANFNADLLRCPLIVADERVPEKCTSADLRLLIGSSARALTRKHLPNATLRGAIRLMLIANNDRMLLMGDEDLDMFDLEAVSSRFLHLDVPEAARDFLRQRGGLKGTEGWVEDDLIARHALWLRDNLRADFQPGSRFLVAGHRTEMHRALLTQGRTSALVTEWLVRFLEKPFPNVLQNKSMIVGNGEILVNVHALSDYWTQFILSHPVPSTQRLGKALHGLSRGERTVSVKQAPNEDYKPGHQYWLLDHDLLLDWAKKYKVGDVDDLSAKIAKKIKVEATEDQITKSN